MEGSPEQKLSLLLGSNLESEISRKQAAFGGLLTHQAAVRLLCQENGISTEEKILLADARVALLPFSFIARVDRVFPIQHFPGGSTQSLRLHISDKSGEATLVLWNEQARLAQGTILNGDWIECHGAYFRSGEIAIMGKGSFSLTGQSEASDLGSLKEGICNVRGRAGKVKGVRIYHDRKTGQEKQMLEFSICNNGKCLRAVAWSFHEGQHEPREGESVALENAVFKNSEIHLNSFSRIVSMGQNQGQTGKFLGMSFVGGSAMVKIGAKEFPADIQEALHLFCISEMQGVPPQELLAIKSRALEGKNAKYLVKEGKLESLKFEG
jgi:hypothetical protein